MNETGPIFMLTITPIFTLECQNEGSENALLKKDREVVHVRRSPEVMRYPLSKRIG